MWLAPPVKTSQRLLQHKQALAARRRAFSSINRPPNEAKTSVLGGAAWRSSVTLYTLPVEAQRY